MGDLEVLQQHHGRGALSNRDGRFEKQQNHLFDDGWGTLEDALFSPPPIQTRVHRDATKTIINRNQSPDIPFDQSINPYRGCEHGCIYCYARPTHAYWGYSPGLDFEVHLFKKENAAELLEAELRKPGYQCKAVTIGANTDPYQPIERRYQITRSLLSVFHAYRHPVALITKSALVMRDLDLLAEMAADGLAQVFVSVTTLDPRLARRMEPRAATPQRRLEAVAALAAAGVPTGVMAAPMIPALNDHELEALLEAAVGHGAEFAGYVMLRLPLELQDLFREWLDTHYPDRANHVFSLVQSVRGGKNNDPTFGKRMRGTGNYAQLLSQRFKLACRRFKLNQVRRELRVDLFQPPPRAGDQMALFT
ncbi:PA0069 family radical SAM protein [Acanthopleuribacter pedis]|uniref:PA0069 family radical SAM protein n=1 Tax=Acanthopleuribacter pedis TaxID=442870 RepID=A0A8J7U6D8_9BACT|nr:PA0069 family radical SAM protein [Acanthopleuribacter pedis]MBO1321809.1 PA0069 family radical SAM protein [Acanthopleuribacter pedis]